MTGIDSLPSTSSRILQAALAADGEAWRELTEIYGPVVYQWLRRKGVHPNDAADVMQEIFLAVHRGLPSYDPEQGPFRNWLFIVARNATISWWRRVDRQPQGDGGTTAYERQLTLPDLIQIEDPSDWTLRDVLRAALEALQSQFEQHTWLAACRVILEGQSPALVAEQLGMSVGAVYTAKSRLLSALRQRLEGLEQF